MQPSHPYDVNHSDTSTCLGGKLAADRHTLSLHFRQSSGNQDIYNSPRASSYCNRLRGIQHPNHVFYAIEQRERLSSLLDHGGLFKHGKITDPLVYITRQHDISLDPL